MPHLWSTYWHDSPRLLSTNKSTSWHAFLENVLPHLCKQELQGFMSLNAEQCSTEKELNKKESHTVTHRWGLLVSPGLPFKTKPHLFYTSWQFQYFRFPFMYFYCVPLMEKTLRGSLVSQRCFCLCLFLTVGSSLNNILILRPRCWNAYVTLCKGKYFTCRINLQENGHNIKWQNI